MKKIFFIAMLLFVGLGAMAQEKTDTIELKKVNADFHLGFNYMNLFFPDAQLSTNSKVGFYGGAAVACNFSKYFGVRLGLDYALGRSTMVDPNDVFGNVTNYNQSSLNMPLLIAFGDTRCYYVGFGFFLSYNLTKSGTVPAGMSYGGERYLGGGFQSSLHISHNHYNFEMVFRQEFINPGFTYDGYSGSSIKVYPISVMVGWGYKL